MNSGRPGCCQRRRGVRRQWVGVGAFAASRGVEGSPAATVAQCDCGDQLHAWRQEMSSTHAIDPTIGAAEATIDLKLEAVVIPVSDVDRAKGFYTSLGWRLDADFPFGDSLRLVQVTPPGSACSVQCGTKITSASPGSAQGLYLIVSDI